MSDAQINARSSAALKRRAPLLAAPDTDSFRLLHRAADGFASLAVDKFNDVLVAHLYDGAQPPLAVLRELAERLSARAVYVKHRPGEASKLTRAEREQLAPAAPLWGRPVEEAVATENGLRYFIHPGAGLSVGLFLDMREVRAWVRAQAGGMTLLNCFSYTCGFGVAATAGGAARVVNVDVSRSALDWGRRNYALNGLAAEPRDFISGDVFDWLNRFGKRGQKADLVLLDPPSYSTTKESRFSVQRDYARLATSAARVVAPGGWLIACANAVELPLAAFRKQLRAGLTDIPARITNTWHEPALDFPLAPGAAHYLKVCVLKVT